MRAAERREQLLAVLQDAVGPVNATQLAGQFSVSRQIIVGDVAVLRARGEQIIATPRGYVLQPDPKGRVHSIACQHAIQDMGAELYALVDAGCTVEDVIVEHPVYGQLTGQLHCASPADVDQFLEAAKDSQPLSTLTDGVHLHTLRCPNEAAYLRAKLALEKLGFLVQE